MKNLFNSIRDFIHVLKFCISLSARTSPKYFILRILTSVVLIFIPFLSVFLSSQMVNVLVSSLNVEAGQSAFFFSFLQLCIVLLIINLANKGLEEINSYLEAMHRNIMENKTQRMVMEKASSLDLHYFDSNSFYNEMRDATNNSPLIIMTSFQVIQLIRYAIQMIVAFCCLVPYSLLFAVLAAISIVPSVIYQNKRFESMYSFEREYMSEERKLFYTSNLLMQREFAKDVRIYNLFPYLSKKFHALWGELFSKKRRLSFRYTVLLVLTSLLPEIVTIAITVHLGYSVISGIVSMGDYTYYQGIAAQLLGYMFMVVFNLGQMTDGRMRITNYLKFMRTENKVSDTGVRQISEESFEIEFKNVSFRYADNLPYVLKNVSFTLHSKERVAFVGINGSGKSSIVKLVLRFYDPTEGQILLNGVDLREYALSELRGRFSIMFQDYCNYAFSVRESVIISDYQGSCMQEEIEAAILGSDSEGFVNQFPNKLDTYLTRQYVENGEELSGGQWQKIALSRTFFRKRPMYILDEPSSALDAESEDRIFQQFEKIYEENGVLLISHRLSNMNQMDKIIVLEDGEIIESGSHQELLQKGGKYAHMYRLQAKKYET